MKSLHDLSEASHACRTVLILQTDHAHWFTVRGKIIESYHCENIQRANECGRVNGLREYGRQDSAVIELILDTTLDEVDRVTVERDGRLMLDQYRQWITMLRLKRDFPRAEVYALPRGYGDSVAAVMRPVIPDHWNSWLERQQRLDKVFVRVMTGSEVAARWSRKFNTCQMLQMKLDGFEKHLLLDRGLIIFLRTIGMGRRANMADVDGREITASYRPSLAASEKSDACHDTIEYLNNNALVQNGKFQCISVRVNDQGGLDTSKKGVVIDSVNPVLFSSDYLQSTVPHPVVPAINSDSDASVSDSVSLVLQMFMDSCATTDCKATKDFNNDKMNRFFTRIRHYMGFRSNFFSGTIMSNASYRWLDSLQPSYQCVLSFRRLIYLRRLTTGLASIALLSAGVSLVSAFGLLQVINKNEAERRTVLRDVDKLSLSINSMSSITGAADSLLLADLFKISVSPSPAWLLEKLATVMTAHPAIDLDGISWSVITDNEPYSSLDKGVSFAATRRKVVADKQSAALQLELHGFVSGETLAIQQSGFEEYADGLSAMGKVSDMQVLDYPADNALSSEFETGDVSYFKIALILSK